MTISVNKIPVFSLVVLVMVNLKTPSHLILFSVLSIDAKTLLGPVSAYNIAQRLPLLPGAEHGSASSVF